MSQDEEKKSNSHIESFVKDFENIENVEDKIQLSIQFMEKSLSQSGTPHFKSFWEARKLCLPLFKENINPGIRAHFWELYINLSKEARRLKEILDEQSAFASEQIEIAIKALEDEIENGSSVNIPNFEIPIKSEIFEKKQSDYIKIQGELNILNAHAARINALRKELIRTEMRIRQKNKFFQRLSLAGDHVFPKRKNLIKQIGEIFIKDVEEFIENKFSNELIKGSLFSLREEIKALQHIAKILTLNTFAFTHTRLKLSECWDKLKEEEKERKKERSKKKQVFLDNAKLIEEKIEVYQKHVESNQCTTQELNNEFQEISQYMRQVELGPEEIKSTKEKLNIAREPLLKKIQQEEMERLKKEEEKERQRHEHIQSMSNQIRETISNSQNFGLEDLLKIQSEIQNEIRSTQLMKVERMDFDRDLKKLREAISEKKEAKLMELSSDDREAINGLNEILHEKMEMKKEIKKQLEQYRKTVGSSGLDFAQAYEYQNQIKEENERLERVEISIGEIKEKISSLEDQFACN